METLFYIWLSGSIVYALIGIWAGVRFVRSINWGTKADVERFMEDVK